MRELLKSSECGHVMRGCAKEDGGEDVRIHRNILTIIYKEENVWCHFDAKRFLIRENRREDDEQFMGVNVEKGA